MMGSPGFIAKDLLELPSIGKVTHGGGEHANKWGVYCDVVTELTSDNYEVYVRSSYDQNGTGARLCEHEKAFVLGLEELESRYEGAGERLLKRIESGKSRPRSVRMVPTYYKYACGKGREMNHRIFCEFDKTKKNKGYVILVSKHFPLVGRGGSELICARRKRFWSYSFGLFQYQMVKVNAKGGKVIKRLAWPGFAQLRCQKAWLQLNMPDFTLSFQHIRVEGRCPQRTMHEVRRVNNRRPLA